MWPSPGHPPLALSVHVPSAKVAIPSPSLSLWERAGVRGGPSRVILPVPALAYPVSKSRKPALKRCGHDKHCSPVAERTCCDHGPCHKSTRINGLRRKTIPADSRPVLSRSLCPQSPGQNRLHECLADSGLCSTDKGCLSSCNSFDRVFQSPSREAGHEHCPDVAERQYP